MGKRRGSRPWSNARGGTSRRGHLNYEPAEAPSRRSTEPQAGSELSRIPREAAPTVAQHGTGLRARSRGLRAILPEGVWLTIPLGEGGSVGGARLPRRIAAAWLGKAVDRESVVCGSRLLPIPAARAWYRESAAACGEGAQA